MTTINVKCHQSARVLRWVRAAIITFFVLFLIKLLTGCSTLNGTITVPTDYGTAVIRSNGGKTSVDLELPRKSDYPPQRFTSSSVDTNRITGSNVR